MKMFKTFSFFVLIGSCGLAQAQTLDCPAVGRILIDGERLEIRLTKGDTDTAYLTTTGSGESIWRADRWRSTIRIPDTLIHGTGDQSATVGFESDGYEKIILKCRRD